MNKLLTITTTTALPSGLALASSCSSGSDDAGPGAGAGVPANAITIADSPTAEATTATAIATGTAYIGAVGIEASTTVTGRDILNIVLDKVSKNTKNSTAIASGVAFNDPCLVSGSVTGDETGSETSFSGTVNFNSCNDGGGIIINGSMSGSGTSTIPSGPYTFNLSGNLTITFDNSSSSIGFNGFSYIASGNDNTGDYTVTTFTYALAPSVGGGFAVQLTQPLVGNEFNFCQLTSGQILVTGAGGSQARGTINSKGTVKVEYHSGDGNFIVSDNSPLDCLL